jgi:nucleotide-binding universal stress UspA family protein
VSATIIAGFDGSGASREAVRVAVRIARARSAQVVAVTGYAVPPHVFGKGASDGADAALTSDARAAADLTLAELDEPGVFSRLVRAGQPARTLIEAADELGASLIAVGKHHSEGLGRLALGTTGERLIHGAPCPVLIFPSGVGDAVMTTIGVAYDDSEGARTALEYAAELARALSARIVMIGVVEPFAGTRFETSAEADRRYIAAIADRAEEAAERLRPELEVEVRTLPGPAPEMLVSACAGGIDLLVTGSRAYGPLRAVLAGSVSRHLAEHATCPLIVVPRELAAAPRPAVAEAEVV